MDSLLPVLVGFTVLLYILMLLLVWYGLLIFRRGWSRDAADAEDMSKPEAKESLPGMDDGSDRIREECAAGDTSRPARRSHTIGVDDIAPMDVVHVETVSGSKYAFTLKDAHLRLYFLEGRSASRGKSYEMEVIVDHGFVPGQCVTFWTADREWRAVTTPVKRLLVDRADTEMTVRDVSEK